MLPGRLWRRRECRFKINRTQAVECMQVAQGRTGCSCELGNDPLVSGGVSQAK